MLAVAVLPNDTVEFKVPEVMMEPFAVPDVSAIAPAPAAVRDASF